MNPDTETNPRPCADSCGTMPACAPLAVPYVPFQQRGSQKYNQADALANGTVFPGLNLPFHMKAEAAGLPDNHSTQLQALLFVVTELGLYLDTHQNDKEALALYLDYVKLAKEGRARYESMYGPLQQTEVTAAGYTWLNDPWPWEVTEGGKQ